jgi:uncharacterized protein
MIVDVHTHFWKLDELGPELYSDLKQAKITLDHFAMDSDLHLRATAAVDKTVVFGLRAIQSGFRISNDTIKEQVDKAPDRLIFFTSVDPNESNFMEELERTHQDLGAKGIKLGPIYQGVHPLDNRFRSIYAYAQKHNLPILIHMATTFSSSAPLDYANPVHMSQVAVDFPDLKLILAHLGHPWTGETIAIIRRHRNVYSDLSALYYRPWQFYNTMRLLVEYGSAHKVFFGSDFPFTLPQDSVKNVRNLNYIVQKGSGLPLVPEDVIEGIINRDTLGILEIQ